jgi:prepilin-type N-terminal cleavage/methylation domain-containing protein
MMKQEKCRRAFTLVEIMIVVMIMGVLLAVATPQFVRANLKARELRLKADLKAVRDALEVAYEDVGTYPMPWDLDKAVPGTLGGWYGTTVGVGWGYYSFTLSQWKGPYLKKYPTANPINGAQYSWNSTPSYVAHAFYWESSTTSSEGTPYNTW